jgi:hypothetical protein
VSIAPALATIAVGVVVERRAAQSRWLDFTWKPVSVLVGQPEAVPWTVLSERDGSTSFYAGTAEIALHRTETASYRDNLSSSAPALWVALRPIGVDPPFAVFGVTADPGEGEGWTQTDGDIVEMLSMPAPICAAIEAFIAEHHVERPFHKRERNRADPEALARRAPQSKVHE